MHMVARLEFGKRHLKDYQTMRNKILWSDETGLNAKRNFWRKPDTISTVKHGGDTIMLWGCFSAEVTGRLVRIKGKMNGGKPAPEHSASNDPKHTAKTTQEWLRDMSLIVLGWPSQSPDLNPI